MVSTKRGRFGRIPRTGTSRSDRHQSPRFTGHRHQRRPIAEAPQERLSPSDGGNVFAHVHCAPGQCAKPSPAKVSSTVQAAYSRIGPRDAHCGSQTLNPQQRPLDCAVTAQIAHTKYAAQYARLVRIWERTDSRFALRFAPLVRTLIREPDANPACGYQAGYHGRLPMREVSRHWFPLWFPGFCSGFHWQHAQIVKKPPDGIA